MSKSPFPIDRSGRLYIDFEFNNTQEAILNLVSCVTFDTKKGEVKRWWLHKDKAQQQALVRYLRKYKAIVGYAAVAEARAFISLGIDPLDWEWIDDFFEYRMISNHNDRIQWGKQLVKGRVRMTRKPLPKWQREEGEEEGGGYKATHSLAEATYKLTGEIRDTKHKDETRLLIISAPPDFSKEQREQILKYNEDDVVHMPKIRRAITKEVLSLDPSLDEKTYLKEAKVRGRYAAHTAWMESRGYPIDYKKTKNFSKQVGNILYDVQKEINELFPDIKPFRWNKPEQRFSWNQIATRQWIRENMDEDRWMKTDGGKKNKPDLSLSLEAWERFFDFKHDYPTDNFGAQMVRFLKLKQSLYGFAESKEAKEPGEKKGFWDYVGKDKMVRPYLNPYAAQSSRSQPAAKGFMFLKPAWMRALVMPAKDEFMFGIDYASQEFFAAALLANDENMMNAYLSGDPYMAFAIQSKQAPPDATKESHKFERNVCKSSVLGISYLMTKWGLAIKLTGDTGRTWTEEEAQEQIDMFYETFWKLEDYQHEIRDTYPERGFIKLPCGWYMYGDNDNIRSICNVPIQGFGASVMRKAVDLAHSRGVPTTFTLHDALYGRGKIGQEWMIPVMAEAMRDAFVFYLPDHLKEIGRKIRLDPFAWSPSYKQDSELVIKHEGKKMKVPASNIYIDDRAKRDYNKFSQYFEDPVEDCL